jgi:ketosteroid isomerase-like protein
VSDQEIAVIREQYEATNRGDFESAMELYSDNVVLTVQGEEIQNPGTYTGKEAVGEWFGDWFRTFAPGYHFDLEEFRDLGGGLVMLFATHGGKGRLSGAPVSTENAYLYRVRDGSISKVGFFPTREDALEAASLPEWSEAEVD